MAEGEWEILEISLGDSGLQLTLPALPHLSPLPGQYFLAFALGSDESIATPLFLAGCNQSVWRMNGFIPPAWQPGTRLGWRGPLGRGFHLPPAARRVALATGIGSTDSLLPLVSLALRQNAAVVWCSDHLPGHLPASVEGLPLEAVAEVWTWADYLVLECELKELPRLAAALGWDGNRRPGCPTEILLHTPLTCGGIADCGVCAVRMKRGWKLACKDGPVFDLEQLEFPQ
jgi:dihydroorotate dehydrogenase electron transfer subunit